MTSERLLGRPEPPFRKGLLNSFRNVHYSFMSPLAATFIRPPQNKFLATPPCESFVAQSILAKLFRPGTFNWALNAGGVCV